MSLEEGVSPKIAAIGGNEYGFGVLTSGNGWIPPELTNSNGRIFFLMISPDNFAQSVAVSQPCTRMVGWIADSLMHFRFHLGQGRAIEVELHVGMLRQKRHRYR